MEKLHISPVHIRASEREIFLPQHIIQLLVCPLSSSLSSLPACHYQFKLINPLRLNSYMNVGFCM
jgi:hypothetical protein